jgi:hypothetical protein
VAEAVAPRATAQRPVHRCSIKPDTSILVSRRHFYFGLAGSIADLAARPQTAYDPAGSGRCAWLMIAIISGSTSAEPSPT